MMNATAAADIATANTSSAAAGEIDKATLYRALAQGVFIMSISTVIGSVMALFICLNVLNECKHLYKWLVRGREAEVVPPSYSAATASPHLPPSYSQCVVQQQETSPPRYSLIYGNATWENDATTSIMEKL